MEDGIIEVIKTKTFKRNFILTSIMLLCWYGLSYLYTFIPYKLLDMILTLITLPILMWQLIRVFIYLDKKKNSVNNPNTG